jgi:hypothetical protein
LTGLEGLPTDYTDYTDYFLVMSVSQCGVFIEESDLEEVLLWQAYKERMDFPFGFTLPSRGGAKKICVICGKYS